MTLSILHPGILCSRTMVALCLLAGCVGVGGQARAEDPLPTPVPTANYAKMASRSPFSPPTAVAAPQATPPPPAPPGWADSLSATMVMQDGEAFMVTVVDSANAQQHLILTNEPDGANQISVASVKWGENRDEGPTITLRKGNEKATIRYESGAGGGPAPVPTGGIRTVPPPIPGVPGVATFRPPMQNTPANGGPATAIRRPLIRSQPPPASRPPVNAPANGVRPNPAANSDDDDDDE